MTKGTAKGVKTTFLLQILCRDPNSGAPTQISIVNPTRISVFPYPPQGFDEKSPKNHFSPFFPHDQVFNDFWSFLIKMSLF
jgi:hypothetical protein